MGFDMKYFLSGDTFYYTRLNLFSWECGKNPASFSETNTEFFISHLGNTLEIVTKKVILINANDLIDVDDHAFDSIINIVKKYSLTFLFFSNDEKNQICKYLEEHFRHDFIKTGYANQNGFVSYYISDKCDVSNSEVISFIDKAKAIERKSILDVVSGSFEEGEVFLSSTALKANGKFNANDIMYDPFIFRWLISLMTEKIKLICRGNSYNKIAIVTSSLRGAVLAGAIKEIIDYSIPVSTFTIFDHIGPNMDFIRCPTEYKVDVTCSAIHIGDFSIAGTELKITKAFCSILGGKITDSFVIGKFTEKEEISDIKVHSLVSLSECDVNLKYELV